MKNSNFGEYNYSIDSVDSVDSVDFKDLNTSSCPDYNNQQGGGITDIINNTISSVKNIFTGDAGKTAPNPSEILNDAKNVFVMLKEKAFDYILEHYDHIKDICNLKEQSSNKNVLHYLAMINYTMVSRNYLIKY